MTTLETLQAKIARLQAQAEEILKKESTTVLAKIKELMDRHDLTTADIDAYMSGRKSSGKVNNKPLAPPAMYRDPKTGATWSGRGRAPGWIARAKDRSKYSVERDAVIGATVNKTPAKAGNYVRGPQPALYVDPKTGATWSGRGRAPAWMANVKDRSKFLIARATTDETEPKAAIPTKAATPAKKTAAKKMATKKAVAKKSIGQKIAAAAKKAPAKKIAASKPVAKKIAVKKHSANATAATPAAEPASTTTGGGVSPLL